jgi:hypothetical protein
MKKENRLLTNRRDFIKLGSSAVLGLTLNQNLYAMANPNSSKMPSVSASTPSPSGANPIDTVKIGIVGTGVRGTEFIHLFLNIPGNEIKAICDVVPEKVKHAQDIVEKAGFTKPASYCNGEKDFIRMCENEELDLVIAATPVDWHVPVCVAAMKNGKHCATEVHATYLLDECWELVETAEKYQKQCCLLENYCYIYNVLMVLKMIRLGLLGEMVHAEAGYQHDVRPVRFGSDGSLLWRAQDMLTHDGNLYPTHAIGPVAHWLDINRGDRLDYLVSMSSRSSGMNVYAKEHFGANHPSSTQLYKQGDVNCTIIKTVKGATITLYYEAQLPRPYEMIYRAQGTKGVYFGNTDQIYIENKSPKYDQWEPASNYLPEYEHPLWTKLKHKAKDYAHWGSDYLMMYRLVEAFRKGQVFEMDVYDAVTWSAISPLSETSVANRSKSIDFPDFTRGKWKNNKPLGIIEA